MKIKLLSFKQTVSIVCMACLILSVAVYGQTQPQRPATTSDKKSDSNSRDGASGSRDGDSRDSGSRDSGLSSNGRVTQNVITYSTSDYKLAPSDVIEVSIEDAPELSSNYTINTDGVITLRFLGATAVAGMTTEEVTNIIADGLRSRYLKDPKVYVTVKQYNSRTFFIQGAVRNPGVYVNSGKLSLFRLLTIAGGLQENHGLTAYIFREVKPSPEKLETGAQTNTTDEDRKLKEIVDNAKGKDSEEEIVGEPDVELITANIGGIIRGRLDNNIVIQPGDVVYIPPADVFYVAGEVRSPGQYTLRQDITLRQAISLAGGTFFKAKLDKGMIFRTDPITGKFSEIPVDIGAVVNGKSPDIPIVGNDVIWVPNSALKSIGSTVLQSLIPAAIFRIPVIGPGR